MTQPELPRTHAATETKMTAVDQRYAERLRLRGWHVFGPAEVLSASYQPGIQIRDADGGRWDRTPEVVTLELRPAPDPGPRFTPADPCAVRCSNPAMHAEGGHDV